MSYIWINPVTESMFEKAQLDEFLKKYGFIRFYTETDWIKVVKDKYRDIISTTDKVVIDVRCPKISELMKKQLVNEGVYVPRIHPILIHCAIEASSRGDLQDKMKIITTPCKAMADMGNDLKLKDTIFISWNDLLREIKNRDYSNRNNDSGNKFGEDLLHIKNGCLVNESPIPLGLFEDLGVNTLSISGKEQIEEYLDNINNQFENAVCDERFVEMLYCKDGCHNGDGIIGE